MNAERAIFVLKRFQNRLPCVTDSKELNDLDKALTTAVMVLEETPKGKLPSIEVGDICRYKKGNGEKFVVTNIRNGMDGLKNLTFFFDGVYEDGTVEHGGTLDLIERVGGTADVWKLFREILGEE